MMMRTWARAAICAVAVAALVPALAAPAPAWPGRDSTPPTAPGNLRVTAVTGTTISLAWDKSTDNVGLNAYIVYQQSSSGTWGLYHSPSSTTFIDNIGVRGFTRTYWVVAEDRSGNRSAESMRVTATTTPDTSPPTAPVLNPISVTQSTATLSWTAAIDDAGSPGYRIFVNGELARFLAPIPSPGYLSTTVRHLIPGTTYTFTVKAADAAGNLSAPSNAVVATTAPSTDVTPPTTPGGLRIASDLGCGVSLVWTASSDDVEAASAIEYEVFVNGLIQQIIVGKAAAFAYHTDVNGLNTFAVRAVDRSGNSSSLSNAVTSVFAEC
jgi:chitinase